VATPEPLLGIHDQAYEQVTAAPEISEHNYRGFSALTEVTELGGMDMQLHVL
jgi:hypothetical protein